MEVALPCVIGATKGLNEPRYPKLPDILKAKRKPVKVIGLNDLVPQKPVQKASVISLEAIPEKGEATILKGDTAEAVSKLVSLFKETALI